MGRYLRLWLSYLGSCFWIVFFWFSQCMEPRMLLIFNLISWPVTSMVGHLIHVRHNNLRQLNHFSLHLCHFRNCDSFPYFCLRVGIEHCSFGGPLGDRNTEIPNFDSSSLHCSISNPYDTRHALRSVNLHDPTYFLSIQRCFEVLDRYQEFRYFMIKIRRY